MENNEFQYVSYSLSLEDYNERKIKTKFYTKDGIEYCILNYDTTVLCFDDNETANYRSVILSSPEKKILCFSPPKSMDIDTFVEKYPEMNDSVIANEIIEGTMINLFFDERIQKWEIATKGAIGANYFYYRNDYNEGSGVPPKTFYRMFLDALKLEETEELNDSVILQNLPKCYSYSFVLQHPENHIVLNIDNPKLYLVALYDITDSTSIKWIPPCYYEGWDIFSNISGIIDFPKTFHESNYDDIEVKHCSIHTQCDNVGIMFTNIETGERFSMKNPTYEKMKTLRGNNPNLQYQYLCLLRAKQIKDFLNFFPQYKRLFRKFYNDYSGFITNIHSSYLTYYVQKQEVQISKKFFPHIYRIHHDLYLPSLQTDTKLIIRRKVVQEFFEKMEPRELLYHLNYDNRELNKK